MQNRQKTLNLYSYAHIGDAVYELFVREKIVNIAQKISQIHNLTTTFVCATFQAELILFLEDKLSDEEKELVRRGKNLHLTQHKRNNQSIHRLATAFEVLIGYCYFCNESRLQEIFTIISEYPKFKVLF